MIALGPQIADLDRPAIVLIGRVELASSAFEAAYHGNRVELAGGATHPVDRPLMFLQVERAQRQAGATGLGHVELVYRGDAVEIQGHALGGGKLVPIIAT